MPTQTVYVTKDASAFRQPADLTATQTFSGWNGNEQHLPIGKFGSNVSDAVGRSLAYFPVSFVGFTTLDSAVLHFMQRNNDSANSVAHCKPTGGTSLAFKIYRMVRDWGESPHPSENTWQAGGTYAFHKNAVQTYAGNTNYVTEGVATASFNQSDDHWETVDITDIVTAWWDHSKGNRTDAPNYGLIFINNDETLSSKGVDLYSEDDPDGNIPYIVVTYNSNTAPEIVPETISAALHTGTGTVGTADRSPKHTTKSITGAANNGSGKIRITSASHGLSTSDTVYITGVGGTTEANGIWNVTVVTSSTFDLIGSTYTHAYTSGGTINKPAVVNTLTPTFAGSIDDPDKNDYITNVGLIIRQVSPSAVMWDAGAPALSGKPTSFAIQYGWGPNQFGAPIPLVGGTVYQWVTNVKDSGGVWGPWGAWDYFIVNTAPNAATVAVVETPNSDILTLTPTVSVTHNDSDIGDTLMHGYEVIVEKVGSTQIYDSGAVDLTSSSDWATTKQVTLPTLTDPDDANAWGTQFRVKARTKDRFNVWGPYSGWVLFTTHITGAPINLAPANDEITPTTTPTFTFDRASSSDTITSYQILLYDDNLSSVWDSGTISTGISNGANVSKAYSGSALSQGTFYQWKARVTSSAGGTSVYSSLSRFKTPSDASVPTSSAPLGTGIQGGGTNPLRPAFVASRAASFNRYQVEVYPSTSTTGNLGTAFYSSGTQSSTIAGGGLGTQFTLAADTVTALDWNTTYKWRARVSADAGSTWSSWSGLASFTMDAAGTPTLTTPTNDQWITDDTPDFTITRAGSDTIDQMRVRVYAADNATILWDSTMTNVTNATTGTLTYSGPTLTGGYYWWEAQYQKTTNGPIGNWATRQRFRLNFPPSVPTDLLPEQGAVLNESLLPEFKARFNDQDITAVGDYPTAWEIVVELNDSPYTNVATITATSDLVVGLNSYVYRSDLGLGTQNTLSYATNYRWKTRFKDSKSIWGAYSSYQVFRPAIEPNSTNLVPSDSAPGVPSVVNQVRPTLSWDYDAQSGSGQYAVNIKIYSVIDANATTEELLAGTDTETRTLRANVTKVTSSASYQLESNYLQDGKIYDFEVSVINSDNLIDPTPQVSRIIVELDAPDPILGLAPTAVEERSVVELHWNAATMKTGHTFVSYNIYKRLNSDDEWRYVDSTYDRTGGNNYDDWYAGHGVIYQYRVTVSTTKTGVGIELESGDDPNGGNISETQLSSDVWMFVGADRNDVHIQELPVNDEGHERVVQQESFEPLGADRKVIIRGFVLGHEGSVTMIFANRDVESPDDPQNLINETVKGRRLLDYLTSNKGPHILKSPFGDVWDAEFEGPKYKWLAGGHLQVDLNWVETGKTSVVSI